MLGTGVPVISLRPLRLAAVIGLVAAALVLLGGVVPASAARASGRPGGAASGSGMPGGAASGSGMPGGAASGSGMPGGAAPGSGMPASAAPVSGRPGGAASASGMPVSGVPASAASASDMLASAAPGSAARSGGAQTSRAPAAAPAQPATVCPPGVFALVNPSFETPQISDPYAVVPQDQVPGWSTTAADHEIEIWTPAAAHFPAPDGTQWVELNANAIGTLYQDVPTVPGSDLGYLVFHRGRTDPNTAEIQIGAPGQAPNFTRQMTDGPDAWGPYYGSYHVPAGQNMTRFAFAAITGTGPNQSIGNFLDGMAFGESACLQLHEEARDLNGGRLEAGDEIELSVAIENLGGFAAFDPVLALAAPAGTRYVPGSLRILDGPTAGTKTDAADGDAGQVDAHGNGTLAVGAGEPFALLRAGVVRHVSYRVKVLDSAAGTSIQDQRSLAFSPAVGAPQVTALSNVVRLAVAARATPTATPTASRVAPPSSAPGRGPMIPNTGPREALPGASVSLALVGAGLLLFAAAGLGRRRSAR